MGEQKKGKKAEKKAVKEPNYRISVRSLAEFIRRSGSIDARGRSFDLDAMQKGAQLHRKLQAAMGSGYAAEVSFRHTTDFDDLSLTVEGRADGVFTRDGERWIDEIKGVYADLEKMEEPVGVHRAQALCYAFFLSEKESLDQIGVQLTYVHLETEKVRRFAETMTKDSLAAWYTDLTKEYHRWLSFRLKWRKQRDASAGNLDFPFPYREGQRRMVGSAYHAIQDRKQIFIQAPTGVGKTMSTIFPAVRSIGEGKGDMLFYLTAKTITRTVAEEAFAILADQGLSMKVLTLTAKEKLCPSEEQNCYPEACPYADGHFDRINETVFELWTTGNRYGRELILETAEKHRVCPYELSLDLAIWVDALICDYNYVFDPDVSLKRFFGEGSGNGEYIFLIDEAHNLPERAREMYSACLCKEDVRLAYRTVKDQVPSLARALHSLDRFLLAQKKELKEKGTDTPEGRYLILETMGMLPVLLPTVFGELSMLFEDAEKRDLAEALLDFYFQVRALQNALEEISPEQDRVYVSLTSDGRFFFHIYCVDPSRRLSARLEKGRSAVFFSATFFPLPYYRRLLSTRTDAYGLYVPSPFSSEKRLVLVGRDVSTRYAMRGPQLYQRIAAYISTLAKSRKGNYLAFFPSYQLLEEVLQIYQETFREETEELLVQERHMTEEKREEYLGRFGQSDGTLVGFAVMGGIFSEGIDLIGERLIGAVIVGTGLPLIGASREVLRSWYEDVGEDGFGGAYRSPGMNKVLQAAGRVIRTKEDAGVILLLDERFGYPEYAGLFPAEWSDRVFCTSGNVKRKIEDFWGKWSEEK